MHFEFPEPTELPPPLIQLNDVSFQYPGRDDFGLKDLNIGIVRPSTLLSEPFALALCSYADAVLIMVHTACY